MTTGKGSAGAAIDGCDPVGMELARMLMSGSALPGSAPFPSWPNPPRPFVPFAPFLPFPETIGRALGSDPARILVFGPSSSGRRPFLLVLALLAAASGCRRQLLLDAYDGSYVFGSACGADRRVLGAHDGRPGSRMAVLDPFLHPASEASVEAIGAWILDCAGLDAPSRAQILAAEGVVEEGFAGRGEKTRLSLAFQRAEGKARKNGSLDVAAETAALAAACADSVLSDVFSRASPSFAPHGLLNPQDPTADLFLSEGPWLEILDVGACLSPRSLAASALALILSRAMSAAALRPSAPRFNLLMQDADALAEHPALSRHLVSALRSRESSAPHLCLGFSSPSCLSTGAHGRSVAAAATATVLFPDSTWSSGALASIGVRGAAAAWALGRLPPETVSFSAPAVLLEPKKEPRIFDAGLARFGPHARLFSSATRDVRRVSEWLEKSHSGWIRRFLDRKDT